MRKMSAYARKMRRNPAAGTYNAAAWLNAIQLCTPHCEHQTIPGSNRLDGGSNAGMTTGAKLLIREAFQTLTKETSPPEQLCMDAYCFIANAVNAASIRLIEEQGTTNSARQLLDVLTEAKDAMHAVKARRESTGRWGFDAAGRMAALAGIEVFENVLDVSTPLQMTRAFENLRKLQKSITNATCE